MKETNHSIKTATDTKPNILAGILIQTRKEFPKIHGNLNELSKLDDDPTGIDHDPSLSRLRSKV
jgi:hypothetical protein